MSPILTLNKNFFFEPFDLKGHRNRTIWRSFGPKVLDAFVFKIKLNSKFGNPRSIARDPNFVQQNPFGDFSDQ